MTDAQATARANLRAAIAASGRTTADYARWVLIRDPRLVRRWLDGSTPIPVDVIRWLDPETHTDRED
jgi:hypothetical protein